MSFDETNFATNLTKTWGAELYYRKAGQGDGGVFTPLTLFPPALLCAEERTLDRIRYGFILHD